MPVIHRPLHRLFHPIHSVMFELSRQHLVVIAELRAAWVMPDMFGNIRLADINALLELRAAFLLLGSHSRSVVCDVFGDEKDLHVWLILAKNVSGTRRGRLEHDEQPLRPPFALHMSNDRERNVADLVREEARMR